MCGGVVVVEDGKQAIVFRGGGTGQMFYVDSTINSVSRGLFDNRARAPEMTAQTRGTGR